MRNAMKNKCSDKFFDKVDDVLDRFLAHLPDKVSEVAVELCIQIYAYTALSLMKLEDANQGIRNPTVFTRMGYRWKSTSPNKKPFWARCCVKVKRGIQRK
jgi:hypothetical protein